MTQSFHFCAAAEGLCRRMACITSRRCQKEAKVSEEQTMWRDPRPRGDREAFPTGDPTHGGQAGMTLREYYAGLAMQGLLASGPHDCEAPGIAHDALLHADALLSALERSRG